MISRPASAKRYRSPFISAATLLAAGALLVGACGSSESESSSNTSDEQGTSTTVAPQQALPEELGEYAVGRTTISFTDTTRDRTLSADVWYPAVAPESSDSAHSRYTFLPTAYFESPTAFDDIEPLEGPFPLLAYSHGNGGISYAASFNMEQLASHGFVVIAPDHLGNTATESVTETSDPRAVVAVNRPQDISAAITEMIARGEGISDDADPDLADLTGRIDPERIGVMGHSFGGFTALTVAGGFGTDSAAIPADDRVDAIIALAPYTELIPDENIESIDIPTMLMVGTDDQTTPANPETDKPWDLIGALPLYRIDIANAGHQTLTDVCDYLIEIPKLPEAPDIVVDFVKELADDGCGEENIDHQRAKAIINGYTTAFFKTFVAGDESYAPLLTQKANDAAADLTFQVKE